jgi:hypothetical protein
MAPTGEVGMAPTGETGMVAPAGEVGVMAPSEEVGMAPLQLGWTTACFWAARLSATRSDDIRFTALTCNAAGEYTLEGMSSSHQAAEVFLDTLHQLPSRATLSWWREGPVWAEEVYQYHFTFQGQFEKLLIRELMPLTLEQSRTLFQKIAAWAQAAGLGALTIKEPLETSLPPGRAQQRQKLWATGSYQQIDAFLDRLMQVQDSAALGEVVIVPVYEREKDRRMARLYAVVDVLVNRP